MMDKLDRICCAIDAQGYTIDGQFYPKEVAIASHKLNMSALCDINIDFTRISEKDRRTGEYVLRYTRLPLDSKDDVYYIYENKDVFLQKYNGLDSILSMWQWVQTPGRELVAIKNNQLATILDIWNIPYVHIDFEKDLTVTGFYKYFCSPTCRFHHIIKPNVRCAKAKAEAIWQFICTKKASKILNN